MLPSSTMDFNQPSLHRRRRRRRCSSPPLVVRLAAVAAAALALAVSSGGCGVEAIATNVTLTVAPSAVRVLKGTASDQGVAVLALKQQSGTQNDWSTYLELGATAASATYRMQFDFALPSGVTALQSLKLRLNSMGLPYANQKRTWSLKRAKDGALISVATNQGCPDWNWYEQAVSVTSPGLYLLTGNTLTVQLLGSNGIDVVDLDYLVLEVVATSSAPSPTKAPTRRPTRRPTKAPTKSPASPPTEPTRSPTKAPSAPTPNATRWAPRASDKLTLQYQLQGVIDTSINTNIFDIDLFSSISNGTVISTLHAQGKKVICYFSAGTYEYWNADWSQHFSFITKDVYYSGTQPPFANAMADWPGERWLDVSRVDLLEPIMRDRLKLAAAAGCDAVDPDNMDAYANKAEAGLPNLTADQQLTYNRKIAEWAHEYGLAVGLKNDLDQLGQLVSYFDFAINEECFTYNECDLYNSFTQVDKPVYGVMYVGDPAVFCPKAIAKNLSFSLKKLSLNAYRVGCETYA